jgi:hypothetical protein
MPQYRCYFYDGDNHITAVETVEVADDAAAQHWAQAICRRHARAEAIELWCLNRMIERRTLEPMTPEQQRASAHEYREKAKEALAQSRETRDRGRREVLKLLAEEYDRLADALEAESGTGPGN